MKTTTEKTMEVVNDLILINNDRKAGYEKAAKETEEHDLQKIFHSMAAESQRYAEALGAYIGQEPVNDTTLKGKIYRAWMDIKATFSGKDRKSVLAACEFGEDAAQNAYEQALKEDLPPETRQVLIEQKASLRKSHDKIKNLRDMQHA